MSEPNAKPATGMPPPNSSPGVGVGVVATTSAFNRAAPLIIRTKRHMPIIGTIKKSGGVGIFLADDAIGIIFYIYIYFFLKKDDRAAASLLNAPTHKQR